jgi:hypothetical protein
MSFINKTAFIKAKGWKESLLCPDKHAATEDYTLSSFSSPSSILSI